MASRLARLLYLRWIRDQDGKLIAWRYGQARERGLLQRRDLLNFRGYVIGGEKLHDRLRDLHILRDKYTSRISLGHDAPTDVGSIPARGDVRRGLPHLIPTR